MENQIPNCPVCGASMMPNIEGKMRNPKAPDFKCTSDNCKFEWDKNANKWVESKFKTSVWANDQSGPKTSPAASGGLTGQVRAAKQVQDNVSRNIQTFEAKRESSMQHLAERRDATLLVTAMIQQGSAWTDDQIKEQIKEWVKWLHNEIYDPPFLS